MPCEAGTTGSSRDAGRDEGLGVLALHEGDVAFRTR